MTRNDVKRLLAEATPRPWVELATGSEGFSILPPQGIRGRVARFADRSFYEDQVNAQLAVRAVNCLPDYEAAVDALEALVDFIEPIYLDEVSLHDLTNEGRAALDRLRGPV